jgi:hypothetical protein
MYYKSRPHHGSYLPSSFSRQQQRQQTNLFISHNLSIEKMYA